MQGQRSNAGLQLILSKLIQNRTLSKNDLMLSCWGQCLRGFLYALHCTNCESKCQVQVQLWITL